MTKQTKNYALPIAMMFALFFMIAFVTGLPSPMGGNCRQTIRSFEL
ncbi:hypothetical protein EZS27_033719 [termite gut metagenome]|uniref:Uncharacterized protein n=1 Tax=termite gut metagenome TaxID=433724 RepID=A0A5J4Q4C3_9ZZZZ